VSDGPRRRPRPTGAKAPASRRAPAKGRAPARGRGKPAPRPGRRIAAGLVVSVVMVGFLLVGVFPTRTWLAQREETRDRQAELDRIRAEQAVQEERVAELQDPDVIEAEARGEYNLVRPGETAYQVMPSPGAPIDLPETWPFNGAEDWLNR